MVTFASSLAIFYMIVYFLNSNNDIKCKKNNVKYISIALIILNIVTFGVSELVEGTPLIPKSVWEVAQRYSPFDQKPINDYIEDRKSHFAEVEKFKIDTDYNLQLKALKDKTTENLNSLKKIIIKKEEKLFSDMVDAVLKSYEENLKGLNENSKEKIKKYIESELKKSKAKN